MQAVNAVQVSAKTLPFVRKAVADPLFPMTGIMRVYTVNVIQPANTFTSIVGNEASNTGLRHDVISLAALLQVQDSKSVQRAIMLRAVSRHPTLSPDDLASLQQAHQQEVTNLANFDASVDPAEQLNYKNTVSGPPVDTAATQEQNAEALLTGPLPHRLTPENARTLAAANVNKDMSFTIGKVRQVAHELAGNISTKANTSRTNATTGLLVTSLVTLLLLLLVALVSTIVARSLIRPLRKLRADALDVAGRRLPEMVRRLSQSEGADEGVEIEPIGVTSTDEIGEVARAFDQVHREAVRLAADEAMLRGNLNAMFINLSRRSQSLIERQLSLIDSLEQSEQDPGFCPACSGLTTWPPACAATPRTCWSWRATRSPGGGASRCRLSTCCAPPSPRSSSTSGSSSTSSPGSWWSARPSTTWCTWSRRSWRTRPRSPRRTPRCTCPASRCPAAACCSTSPTTAWASPTRRCRTPTGGWTTRRWSTWPCPAGWACSWSAARPLPGTASGSGCGTLRPHGPRTALIWLPDTVAVPRSHRRSAYPPVRGGRLRAPPVTVRAHRDDPGPGFVGGLTGDRGREDPEVPAVRVLGPRQSTSFPRLRRSPPRRTRRAGFPAQFPQVRAGPALGPGASAPGSGAPATGAAGQPAKPAVEGTPAGNNWEPAGNGWDLGNGQAIPDHQDGPPTQALPVRNGNGNAAGGPRDQRDDIEPPTAAAGGPSRLPAFGGAVQPPPQSPQFPVGSQNIHGSGRPERGQHDERRLRPCPGEQADGQVTVPSAGRSGRRSSTRWSPTGSGAAGRP